jgi:indole-3-glycerol phosphate synthase
VGSRLAETPVILDQILAHRRAHRPSLPLVAPSERRSFKAALEGGVRPRVIAEFKRRSPSAGPIRLDADPAEIARRYQAAGAAALSVLTESEFFDGHPQHLVEVRRAVTLPVLRKDFLLDERDVIESHQLGADAILLIVRILQPAALSALLSCARGLGLDALVETHSEREIDVALAAGAEIIGVNHRDLDTLEIDLSLSARARERVGEGKLLVAESGIRTPADVARMRSHGADAILVGEQLMKSPDPGQALEQLCS